MTATTMHGDIVTISDEQFSKLVELLTPGFEVSKLMLAELQERDAMRKHNDAERLKWAAEREAREQGIPAQTEPTEPPNPSFDLPADAGLAAPDTAEPAQKTLDDLHGTLGA